MLVDQGGASVMIFSDYKAAKCHFRRVHRQASETFMKINLTKSIELASC